MSSPDQKEETHGNKPLEGSDKKVAHKEGSPDEAVSCSACCKQNSKDPDELKSESPSSFVCGKCEQKYKALFDMLDTDEPHDLIPATDDFREYLIRAGYETPINVTEILESLQAENCGIAQCVHNLTDPDSEEPRYICFPILSAFFARYPHLYPIFGGVNWTEYQCSGGGADFKNRDSDTAQFVMVTPIDEDILTTFGSQNTPPIQTISIDDGNVYFSAYSGNTHDPSSKVLTWNSGSGTYETVNDVRGSGLELETFSIIDRDAIRAFANNTAKEHHIHSYVTNTVNSTTRLYLAIPNAGTTVHDPNCKMFSRNTSPPPSSSCFPGSAHVLLGTGDVKPIPHLQIGDRVMTFENGQLTMTEVYGFGFIVSKEHKHEYLTIEFVNDANSTGHIELTDRHFIYRSNNEKEILPNNRTSPVEAWRVKTGDYLWTVQSDLKYGHSRVVSVKRSTNRGKYAPLTLSGTLIVNGTFVSCFDDPTYLGLSHNFWQAVAYPTRLLYRLAGCNGVVRDSVGAVTLWLGHTIANVSDFITQSTVHMRVKSIYFLVVAAAVSWNTYGIF